MFFSPFTLLFMLIFFFSLLLLFLAIQVDGA